MTLPQPRSRISNSWTSPHAIRDFHTGVSLHSHTSCSVESLDFIHKLGQAWPGGKAVTRFYAHRVRQRHGIELDFLQAHWRPPLQPRMAFKTESRQIAELGLAPLVSITDHDTLEGTLLLRTLPLSRHIPMSVEWTAPFGATVFHLGIHNLPSARGAEWMQRLAEFTAAPNDALLLRLLRELHGEPQVLIVFNHPLWDLYNTGSLHRAELLRFLREAGETIHALELNGLRHARENGEVAELARQTGHLLISGGDRHGMEPNANINLTAAKTFTGFVHEVRFDRVSHVHFMPQYQRCWRHRMVDSTLQAITDHPSFMPGWQRWDERAFHADAHGVLRPLCELWPGGRAPLALRAAITVVRLMKTRGVAAPISMLYSREDVLGFDNGYI